MSLKGIHLGVAWAFGLGVGYIMTLTLGFHHHCLDSSSTSSKRIPKPIGIEQKWMERVEMEQKEQKWMETVEMEQKEPKWMETVEMEQNEQKWMETVEMEDRETSKETDHHQRQKDPKEDGGPPMEYQQLLHIIEKNINELSAFVLMNYESEQKESRSSSHLKFLEILVDRIRVLKFDISDLRTVDGHESWREREAKELSDLVQHRLKVLQNPSNCSEVKKILCRIDTRLCGICCIIHHLNTCMMVAYGFGRTMVLRSKGWRYAKKGWESIMKPVGSCSEANADHEVAQWPGSNDYEDEIISFPDYEDANPSPPSMPQGLPQDIADRLIRLHGEPGAWYQGQVTQLFWRLQPFLQKEVDKIIQTMKIHSPVVGLHIRQWRDKLFRETRPITLEEYMKPVEEYYDALRLKGPVPVRRVFVVTDLPDAVSRLRAQYKAYTFITNERSAGLANENKRYSTESLIALYADVYLLSRVDYLVTTLTSNVGRMAYEIMQTLYPDASAKVFSLDKPYYVHCETGTKWNARYKHALKRDPKVSFDVGNIVEDNPTSCRKGFLSADNFAFPLYKLTYVYRLVNTTWHSEIDRTLLTQHPASHFA